MQVQTSYKDIWKLAYPVMISSIAMTIINITDTAFLGRVGELELGASAVGGVLYFVFAMIGISIGIGAQIMIARRSGEKKDESIGEIFDHTLLILFAISILLFIILKYLSSPLLNLILHSPELVQCTEEFLSFRSYGIFAVMMATVFRSFYVGIARPNVYGVYSFLMAGINILLGYIFIYGNYGMPSMGIRGAGMASSIAEFSGFIFLLLYTVVRSDISHYRLFRFQSRNGALVGTIMNLSAPLMVQNLLSMGAWFFFFTFIEKLGAHELAIANIVRGAYMISMTPMWGLSISANSMVSNIIGQGRLTEVMPLLNRIIRFAILVSTGMVIVNVVFPEWILSIFTNEQTLINDSKGSLEVVDLSMFFFSFAIVSISALSGTGATKTALMIEIAAISIYMVYNYAFTFIFPISAEVLWMSEVIYWLITGLASYIYIRSMRWKNIHV